MGETILLGTEHGLGPLLNTLSPRTITVPSRSAPPPAAQAAFTPATTVGEAEAFTRRLAHGRYENFSVVSVLVPRHIRQDFCNIYAFCRLADDLGDEVHDPAAALAYLGQFRDQLRACYAGRSESAVFLALAGTVERHSIPIDPFLDLISAFEQDQHILRYETLADLADYCRRSADPVGRLVLYLCGYRDEERQRLSDLTCTALQLANFWQDVRRDLADLDRIYIPREFLTRFGVTEEQLRHGVADDHFRAMMRELVERTDAMFADGRRLLPLLSRDVAAHVSLFGLGGQAILRAIRRQDFDTLSRRPTLGKRQKAGLVARAAAARLTGYLGGRRRA
jgi:squalene synthase HpnC